MSSGLKTVVQVGSGKVGRVNLSSVQLECEVYGKEAEDEVTGSSSSKNHKMSYGTA